jgi:acyl-CoA thioesterase-1
MNRAAPITPMKNLLFTIVALLAFASAARAQTPSPDPALVPVKDVAGLPRVLIIGDSVSIGYTAPVRALLQGKANVHRIPQNGSSTGYGLQNLPQWLGDGSPTHQPPSSQPPPRWDVIHFNFGLHDAKQLPEGTRHSDLPSYEKNLREIVKQLRATGAKLIWATTTPVPDGGVLSPTRRFDDITAYNAVAKKVMEENGVAIDDLHAAILPKVASLQIPHDVHFTKEGSQVLAERVAVSIAAQLPAR